MVSQIVVHLCLTVALSLMHAWQVKDATVGCGDAVNVDAMQLLDNVVHVVWKWEWAEDDDDDGEENNLDDPPATSDHVNHYLHSSDEDSHDVSDTTPTAFSVPYLTHTVTFKCIGTTRDYKPQEVLAKVSQLLTRNEKVPVIAEPEPTNQFDSRAICFKCLVDGEWHRIGYIVRTCTHCFVTKEDNLNQLQVGEVPGCME